MAPLMCTVWGIYPGVIHLFLLPRLNVHFSVTYFKSTMRLFTAISIPIIYFKSKCFKWIIKFLISASAPFPKDITHTRSSVQKLDKMKKKKKGPKMDFLSPLDGKLLWVRKIAKNSIYHFNLRTECNLSRVINSILRKVKAKKVTKFLVVWLTKCLIIFCREVCQS